MSKELPSPELLRKLLRYEPETGKLFWRERGVEMFSDGKQSAEHTCNIWNSKHAGKEALTARNSEGYRHGRILGRSYKAHRVIWAMVHGEWPVKQLDHVNGVRDDNRIKKLRQVTKAENSKNLKRPSNNNSGVMGVCWVKRCEKWRSQIQVKGKNKFLGYFTDFNEAVAARKAAEVKYGFHKNHGRAS